tara:strand:+ start:3720 stop:4454 length:735 start_codon:yes stop_codon:yes gene_type:complete
MIGASRSASTREYQVLSTTNITSTGTQTYTVPAGVVFLEIEMYGGGGGGGLGGTVSGRGSSTHTNGEGGGGGAYVKHRIRIDDLRQNDTITVSLGAGGSPETSNNLQPGDNGGDSTLNKHERGGSTITTFSNIRARGGVGGRSNFHGGHPNSGEGGTAEGGNLSNDDGGDAADRTSGSFTAIAGTSGAAAASAPERGGAVSGASAGFAATVGDAVGGGGGGGASTVNVAGASGADGKIIIKAFG